jgi:hypothetical protein
MVKVLSFDEKRSRVINLLVLLKQAILPNTVSIFEMLLMIELFQTF